jgi:hypothetical protein
VTSGDDIGPRFVVATDAAGVAAIDTIVARRKAIVARLTLGARMARQRLDRVEQEWASRAAGAEGVGDAVPDDLLAVVDAMLDKAVRASDGALEAARAEADAVVVAAVMSVVGEEGAAATGVDPHRLPRQRPLVGTDHRVTPPPTAADLWRGVTGVGRGPAVSLVGAMTPPATPVNHAPVSDLHALPSSSLPAPSDVGGDALDPVRDDSAVGTLVLDAPSEEWLAADSADAFDTFWQEVRTERRVRDRLRRRGPKEDS